VHFLANPMTVGPLRKIYRLKLFRLFRALFVPSELVSRSGSVRRTNLTALMVVLCTLDAIFAEFDGIFSYGRKICESFKDLKEFHEFFVLCCNL
jgi:hypothetical protein